MKRVLLGGVPALALAIAVFALSPAQAATNLFTNPGFEDGGGSYTGWITFGNGIQISNAASDNIFRSGVAGAKMFGEFNDCPIPNFDVGGFLQSFTPTPGNIYTMSGFSWVSSGDPIPGTDTCLGNRAIAKIAFFDAAVGGAEIQTNEIVIGNWTSPVDTWVPFTVSAPAPAGALRVEALFLFLQPGCDVGTVYVDDVSFCSDPAPAPEPNLLTNPSFDTDLSGWTAFGNALFDGRSFARRTEPGGAKLFGTFAGGFDSGFFQSFAAAPGSEWCLSAYTMTTCVEDAIRGANQNFVQGSIVFRDSGGTDIGGAADIYLDATASLGQWTQSSTVAMAPPGTVTAEAVLLFVQPDTTEGGAAFLDDVNFQQKTITDAPELLASQNFELRQNWPNPFAKSTQIEFVLETREAVDITVYDVAGRRVANLVNRPMAAGAHSVSWDGTIEGGQRAAAGVYQYVMKTSTGLTARSMMLLR